MDGAMHQEPETYYLPAALSPAEEFEASREAFGRSQAPLIFQGYPLFTIFLDPSRRILWANAAALDLMGTESEGTIGRRLGEAMDCVHWSESPGGCGTGAFCALCGFARNLERALGGESLPEECMLRRGQGEREESLDLLVWSRLIPLGGRDFVMVGARDISGQKRREVLERVFNHDIANTVNGIQAILEVLRPFPEEEDERYFALLRSAAAQLVEEIDSHRALKAAEERSLPLNPEPVDAKAVLESALAFFAYSLYGKSATLSIDPASDRPIVETDPVLLKRILINMIKNALEAAEPGERIVVRCSLSGANSGDRSKARAIFAVRNRAVMPEEARRRVFLRSFSTKGAGRGVGTYGMKILGERYLRGKLSFSSREGEGTVFILDLPLDFPG